MKKFISILVFSLCGGLSTAHATKPFQTLQWQTHNGTRVVFYQAMEVPMLDINIAFAAGSAYDGDAYGLSFLTTHLLTGGANGLDETNLAERLASTGAQYNALSNRDMAVLSLRTLTEPKAFKNATQIFKDILAHPDFPIRAFNQQKQQQLMAILQAKDSPQEMAEQTFFKLLYQDHPYAHPILGDTEHVEHLALNQVRDFYHHYFVSQNAVIVMVGAIEPAKAKQLAEQLTEALPKGNAAPSIPTASALTEPLDVEVKFPSTQTNVRLGQLAITHQNPHYFPLLVGNYILGGESMGSQLSEALREKRGLTYGVYSQLFPMPGGGPFMISLATRQNQSQTAIEITRNILQTFIQKGPNEQELKAAKQYLAGSFPLSLASNRSIADILLKIAFYHLPEDFLTNYTANINAVQAKDVQTAFQKDMTPNNMLQVTVGKI